MKERLDYSNRRITDETLPTVLEEIIDAGGAKVIDLSGNQISLADNELVDVLIGILDTYEVETLKLGNNSLSYLAITQIITRTQSIKTLEINDNKLGPLVLKQVIQTTAQHNSSIQTLDVRNNNLQENQFLDLISEILGVPHTRDYIKANVILRDNDSYQESIRNRAKKNRENALQQAFTNILANVIPTSRYGQIPMDATPSRPTVPTQPIKPIISLEYTLRDETLYIKTQHINSQNIGLIIDLFKKYQIKKLNLIECKIDAEASNLLTDTLANSSLRVLCLDSTDILCSNLSRLIRNTTTLKELHLIGKEQFFSISENIEKKFGPALAANASITLFGFSQDIFGYYSRNNINKLFQYIANNKVLTDLEISNVGSLEESWHEAFKYLQFHPHIRRIKVVNTPYISAEHVQNFLIENPYLPVEIIISSNPQIQGPILDIAEENIRRVESIRKVEARDISEADLQAIIQKQKNTEKTVVIIGYNLTPDLIEVINHNVTSDTTLKIYGCNITNPADIYKLFKVQTLDLTATPVPYNILRDIIKNVTTINELNLKDTGISNEDMLRLASTIRLTKSHTKLIGFDDLNKPKVIYENGKLVLAQTSLDLAQTLELAKMIADPSVTDVIIRDVIITSHKDEIWTIIIDAIRQNRNITRLDFSGCELKDQDLRSIFTSLQDHPNLEELELDNNEVELKFMLDAPGFTLANPATLKEFALISKFKKVNLRNNEIDYTQILLLLIILSNQQNSRPIVDISSNRYNAEEVQTINAVSSNQKLNVICISNFSAKRANILQISGEVNQAKAAEIADIIRENKNLFKVMLYNIEIDRESTKIISDAIQKSTSISKIDISNCKKFEAGSFAILYEGLTNSHSVSSVNIDSFVSMSNLDLLALEQMIVNKPSLREILLPCRDFTEALRFANSAAQNSSIESFYTRHFIIKESTKANEQIPEFLEAIKNKKTLDFTALDIYDNYGKNLKALIEFIQSNSNLENIIISSWSFNKLAGCVTSIVKQLSVHPNIKSIAITNNNIDIESAQMIAYIIRRNMITKLDLSNSKIEGNGLRFIIDALRDNTSLLELNLSSTNLTNVDAVKLSKNIPPNLKVLNLCSNKIQESGAYALINAASKNLRELNLELNLIFNNILITDPNLTTFIQLDYQAFLNNYSNSPLKRTPQVFTLSPKRKEIEHNIKRLRGEDYSEAIKVDFECKKEAQAIVQNIVDNIMNIASILLSNSKSR